MKTVERILIILVVAGAIAGLTLLVVNVSGLQASQPFAEQQFGRGEGSNSDVFLPEAEQAGLGSMQFNPGSERGGFDPDLDRGTGGVFSLVETLKNIIVVAAIVAIFVAGEHLLKVIRGKRLAQAPVSLDPPYRKE